jgi:hypothetical protein
VCRSKVFEPGLSADKKSLVITQYTRGLSPTVAPRVGGSSARRVATPVVRRWAGQADDQLPVSM